MTTVGTSSFCRLVALSLAILLIVTGNKLIAADVAATVYDVGVAKVDVTPSYPIRLNGFGFRRDESEGITQKIWAKALAIGSDADGPAILFTIDSLGVRQAMVDQVAARLKAKAGVRRDRIAVTFTHTHTAPKLNGVCDTIFSSPIPPAHQEHIDRYEAELTKLLEQVALDALADRKPSRLEWAVGNVGFAKNRRTEGGPVDHALPALVVRSADGNSIRAIYTTYACHCVTLSNNKVSGDWAGFAQHAIEAKHPGAIAMVSIGCGSDSNPNSGVAGDNTAAAADQGAQIADEVERLLSGTLKPVSGPFRTTLTNIDLPLAPPPSREDFEALAGLAAKADPTGYNALIQLEKLKRGEPLQTALDYPIQTWAFGDSLAMVFLAGEVCVDYSLRLKAELDPQRVWMHGYSNDFCAYIPSERLLKEGGYGGGGEIVYFALPSVLAPGVEEKVIAQVHKQVPKQFEGQGPRKQASAQPWPLEEALASIKVKPGYLVEVAAAEPLVADPVAIDFGPDGRMWVAEMPDYARFADEEFQPSGSVRVLTDRDNDGRFDEASTFETGLRFPTDVKVWRNGVIVCDAPDVIYLEDTDGDGQADTRQVLLSGFETHNAQARVNSLRWGLDGWIYGSCGLFGGNIKTSTGRELALGSRDFRFRPDTGEIEAVTGKTQQGRARDDWGNWFGCENGSLLDHYPLVDGYLSRNPHIAPPPAEVFVPTGKDPNVLHPIGNPTLYELSGSPGRPTSVCGLEIYRDDLLGKEYANNAFVAEPVNQLVHRRILSPRGATFSGARAVDEIDVEFLASTDPWFRPVQLRTGLDGCLYVVDMHRAVIEHQKFIPQETLAKLELTAGREQGRVYRVRPKDAKPRPAKRLDQLTSEGLAAAIDSSNGPLRDLAQQMLLQRGDLSVAAQLRDLAKHADSPAVRVQALCTLEGLKAIDVDAIIDAMSDADPSVRRHAVRLSEPFLETSPELADAISKLADEADPQVLLQLASSLGECNDARAADALAKIALAHRQDPYILAGVWSSVSGKNVRPIVERLLAGAANGPPSESILDPAIRLILELGSPSDFSAVAGALKLKPGEQAAAWKFDVAAKLLNESRRKAQAADGLNDQLTTLVAAARATLQQEATDEAQQLAALRMLVASSIDRSELLPMTVPLLEPRNSPTVQQAAIDLVASIGGADAGSALLAPWRSYSPSARAHAFDVVLGDSGLTNLLLNQFEAGNLTAADLDTLQRQRLLAHADSSLRSRAAEALVGALDENRASIVKKYSADATGSQDAGRGRQLFAKHCSSCHRLEGQGFEVGPDLAALTSRTRPALLESILDPNRTIDERYRSYTALTVDGLAHAGVLTAETSTSITLMEQQGKQHTLLRSELEALENTGKSLMPEGFERDLSPLDMNDLVAYLETVGPQAKNLPGNHAVVIKSDYDGTLWLTAASGEIYGNQITFEAPYQNIGYWHDQADFVAWTVDVSRPGQYDVYLDWACEEPAAGNRFVVDGGDSPLEGVVESTGTYDRYQIRSVGGISLPSGQCRIIVRPNGPLTTPNLIDLRGLYLAPAGSPPNRILHGMIPVSGRDAATAIAELLDGLAVGQPQEYERIPQIWQEAIAAGRRNNSVELARVIDLSLPRENEPLADWQSVVLGGGVVNGVSQAGAWPASRIAEILKDSADLSARWRLLLPKAAKMAEDSKVRTGTRYDALRILGAGEWEDYGAQLVKRLDGSAHHELQMGAVSALCDMESTAAVDVLIRSLRELEAGNRQLAVAGLIRNEARASALLDAIASGVITRELLTSEQYERAKELTSRSKD